MAKKIGDDNYLNTANTDLKSKTTVPYVSAPTDTEQSSITYKNNISQKNDDCNTFSHETLCFEDCLEKSEDNEDSERYVISFEKTAKEVTVRDYVSFVGIPVNRAGKINCPFHNDRTPSMKVDSRYHCFGCGADGNVIDFVSSYYGISKYEAACRITEEFHLDSETLSSEHGKDYKEKIDYGYIKQYILNYLIYVEKEMKSWLKEYAPKLGDEELHFLFRTASQWLDYVSYLTDTLSGCRTADEIRHFLSLHEGEVIV
ncbi:MAG: hypothetical protein IK085_01725 [Clostridia bacterium]|nr:hypothetical protein [Clostridia bacterium]